jgi:predicted pyridoxine 5'-phosphate oxidase superfamily flavin-nucleotide-binding protein
MRAAGIPRGAAVAYRHVFAERWTLAMNHAPLFHAGELAVQQRAGTRALVDSFAPQMVRDAMPLQHQQFFAQLPTLFVGSLDALRRPWASVLVGTPGFIDALDARHLRIRAPRDAVDPLSQHLSVGDPIGLLGLEPQTRRRNRLNGTVTQLDARHIDVQVDQSFGNCPQYIQAREPQRVEAAALPARPEGAALSADAAALVRAADTLFIASASPHARGNAGADGVDVSHRGGRPGFVRIDTVDGHSVLTVPDFRGNRLFNTLGNIAAHPHAGLLFIDYARGDVLQLTGDAELVWDGTELLAFEGAQRLLRLRVEAGVWRPGALPLRWSPAQPASQLAQTGAWR